MTKAKTTKAAESKKDEEKASTKKKTDAKSKTEKVEKKPLEKAAKTTKKTKETAKVDHQAPNPTVESKPTPVIAFSHSGLGIKTSSSKKPALSVAPGVMILGRPAQAKIEQAPKQSDRRLSKKEQQEIKSFLLERRERLVAGMRRELAMQRERAESKVADEVDKATDAYDEDLSFEIAVANDQELGEIQVALEKIDRGTYGECEICGCTISPSRLKILPSATTCVACRGQEELARRRDDGNQPFSMLGEDGEAEEVL